MNESRELAILAERLLEFAVGRGMRLAVAESLTGGMLADAFVAISGASQAFVGGIVAYDTALKHRLLGVDNELLDRCGPVDGEVAKQMAKGVRLACSRSGESGDDVHADIGLSTTGVAGPDPDPQTGQPAGTLWVGVSSRLGERSVKFELDGDRDEVRAKSVASALLELSREFDRLAES